MHRVYYTENVFTEEGWFHHAVFEDYENGVLARQFCEGLRARAGKNISFVGIVSVYLSTIYGLFFAAADYQGV